MNFYAKVSGIAFWKKSNRLKPCSTKCKISVEVFSKCVSCGPCHQNLTRTRDKASPTEAELTKEVRGRKPTHVLVPVDTAVDTRGPHMSSSRVAMEETWSAAWKKRMMNLRRGNQMEMSRWVTLWAYLQRQGSSQEFHWLQATDANMMVYTECDIIFLLQLDILRYVIRVPIAIFLLIPPEFMALVLKVLTNGPQWASHST